MGRWFRNAASGFCGWLANIYLAVVTVAQALWVTIRYWVITYDPQRRTFTEHYEYPELPIRVSNRFRGFHRFDLTTCIGCERCARDCPVDCIYVGKERAAGRKGFQVTSFTIDYTKCMFCALCTESCPVDCIFMGSTYDLSSYSRDGCIVDFSRLPVEIAWGRSTLNSTALARSKRATKPVHDGPGS
jgi:NADH-quinone oxidoreductase subunit I